MAIKLPIWVRAKIAPKVLVIHLARGENSFKSALERLGRGDNRGKDS